MKTFIESIVDGEANPEDVCDWADRWHTSDTKVSLMDYLGFNKQESQKFMFSDDVILEAVERVRKEKLSDGSATNFYNEISKEARSIFLPILKKKNEN